MNTLNLAIIMTTYNGEKYLKGQIDSILNQTYDKFTLYIRDDNSTDNTKNIIKEYTLKFTDKIIEIKDNKIAGGACNNFLFALEYVYNLNKHNIFMFSDQDDVWLKEKIEITLNEYNNLENKDKPILIHTDLYVADKELNIIDSSFVKLSHFRKDYTNFNNYLIQNNVTGCTVFINKDLADLINFKITNIIMHDWFFALIASAFGQVRFINQPTIYYRQHERNTIGAKNFNIYDRLIKNNTIKKDIYNLFLQAEAFRDIYYNILTIENKNIIDAFCKIKNSNKLTKLKIINEYKFYKQGLIKFIGELFFI